jgi:hypothetical protein
LIPTFSHAVQESSEVLIWRAPIPSKQPYQGEVRLIRRDSTLVMQTILNSKVLKHVIAAIRKKELRAWPEDREGWIDSRRYTDELFRAYETIQARAKNRKNSEDRHLKLLIEFVLEERHSYVALYAPIVTKNGDHLSLQGKELLKKLRTSRTYLYNNLQEIAQDSFQLENHEVLELLRPIPGEL